MDIEKGNNTTSIIKKRSNTFDILLFLYFVSSLIGVYFSFLNPSLSAHGRKLANLPSWITPFSGFISLFDVIFLFGVWKWKKWGIYGLIATTILEQSVSIVFGSWIIGLTVLAVALLILYRYIIKPHWQYFE